MDKIKRVLVALKPWQRGLPLAAYHARFLAERLDAELTLLSCVFEPTVDLDLARSRRASSAAGAQSGLLQAEKEHLEELAGSLRDWGLRVLTRVVWDQPVYEGILKAVDRSGGDLLVIGAHEPRPFPHTRLTDIDWQLMRLCPCPVLLVKDPDFEDYPRMLATVDPLHRHAEPAGLDRAVLGAAQLLSAAFEAKLRVLNAYPDPEDFELASAVEVLPGVFYGVENMEALHREATLELAELYGVSEVDVRPGNPAEVIVQAVADLDVKLVVIGATKRGRAAQALLGSTAEIVADAVPCDILAVK
jgi:universal stress protein E